MAKETAAITRTGLATRHFAIRGAIAGSMPRDGRFGVDRFERVFSLRPSGFEETDDAGEGFLANAYVPAGRVSNEHDVGFRGVGSADCDAANEWRGRAGAGWALWVAADSRCDGDRWLGRAGVRAGGCVCEGQSDCARGAVGCDRPRRVQGGVGARTEAAGAGSRNRWKRNVSNARVDR